jgi:hypothetical protein
MVRIDHREGNVPVILTASFQDLSLSAITSHPAALERARELQRLGWDVELRDDVDDRVAWDVEGTRTADPSFDQRPSPCGRPCRRHR